MTDQQFFPFKAIGVNRTFRITYPQIIAAMEQAKENGSVVKGRTYAVMNPRTGDTFAPKDILRSIIGNYRFAGGKGLSGANRVFHVFGFPVGSREKLLARRKQLAGDNRKSVSVQGFLKELFSRKWKPFPTSAETLRTIIGKEYRDRSGVYVFACSEENLQGQRIHEADIFYVGMTCEGGLTNRLLQFQNGIRRGGCHSGADRFYRLWLRRTPYDPDSENRLFFAYVPILCESDRAWRSQQDILSLSTVAALEYEVIARVKNVLGHEPLLNKK